MTGLLPYSQCSGRREVPGSVGMAGHMAHAHAVDGSGQFHAVRFYKDSDSLCMMVAEFLSGGMTEGQPAVVLATPDHRAGIVRHLTASGIDADKAVQAGTLHLIDADTALAEFMVNGSPDAGRFTRTMLPILEKAAGGQRGCVVRAYGEMVDVLWKKGQIAAATRLEMLWNDLASRYSFSLLCGYAMGNFYKDAAVEDICTHHTHVISDNGLPAILT